MAGKKNKGPRSLKSRKKKNSAARSKRRDAEVPSQTNDPFEQDAKRRIGQHSGTGEPPLMKK
jgi:hypothetical protein